MKKTDLLRLFLICVCAASLILFSRVVFDNDDGAIELLCSNNEHLRYVELLESILSPAGIFYEYRDEAFCSQPIILYLERQEKSPPFSPTFSLVV